MADLTLEQFEQVPEFLKGDFEQVGEVYRHKTEGKVATLKTSLDGLDAKLKAQQAEEKAKIEAAKAEALESARNKGDVAAAEKLYKEQMADLTARIEAERKESNDRLSKIAENAKKDKKAAIKTKIIAENGIPDGSETFDALLDPLIDYDPETGKEIYFNLDGSASSLDRDGFVKELYKMKRFAPVLKASVNTGGIAKGSNQDKGSARKEMKRADFEALPHKARADFMREGGKLTE